MSYFSFVTNKDARFSLANSDFVYPGNCDEIVKTFFPKPKGDSFLNFGLTNEERAFEYNRKIKEACRPNHFKLRSERGHCGRVLIVL